MKVKITGINVYVSATRVTGNFADSSRDISDMGFVIAEVTTDAGVSGIGLTYQEVGCEAIRQFIKGTIEPLVVGMSPFETEVIWEKVFNYFRGVGRKGLAFCSLSAVDIALWDVKGKLLGLPLFRLLGGTNNQVPAYASGGWTSFSVNELIEEAEQMSSEGFKLIKVKVGVEGGNNFREDVRRMKALRKAVGPELRIAIDANNIWKSGTAVQFAHQVEDCDIEFFEEPVLADDIPGLARCRQSMSIPLATGEHEYTRFGVRDLLTAGAADIVQADVCRVGGYTEMMKIIALTQAFNVSFAPHCMELMHMHLVAAAHNALYVEVLTLFREAVAQTFIDPPVAKNGILTLPEKPGLGLELNMDYIRKHGL